MRKPPGLPGDSKRLIYDLTPFGLPEVPYLAAQNLSQSNPSLPRHIHKGRMEINHFLKGERVYRVGGRDYHLKGNQIFVTWPDEVHSSGSFVHGRGAHFWIQLQLPDPGSPFLGLSAACAEPLLEMLWKLPRRQFHADPAMHGVYLRMLQICREGPSRLAQAELTALMTEWLLAIVVSSERRWEDEITPDIAKALEFARDPRVAYSVGQLADAACLSESHFKIKFKQQLGVSPGDYLLRRRVEAGAELLLKGSMSITEIALELAFSSSQHFSTTFKKFFGTSPQAWVKKQSAETTFGDRSERPVAPHEPWIEDGVLHGHLC